MNAGSRVRKRRRLGRGRPTLRDVAEVAGVTAITVSRFIHEPERVAVETAARIRGAIEQIGYVANRQAGQLANGKSHLVAALIPNVGYSIFAETIQGLTEGLAYSGYELLLLTTGYSMDREEAQLRMLMGWAPAALIVTGRHHTPSALRILRDAHMTGTPVVEIWDYSKQASDMDGFAKIGFDHFDVGRTMARHFLNQGHETLAYVDSGVPEDFRAHERGQGFVAEALAAGAAVKVLRAAVGDAFDVGRRAVVRLTSGKRHPVTAVAFANDQLACGGLMEAQAKGIQVPSQLALLGFGDFPVGRQMRPALSTLRPPRAEIGRAAAAVVLESMSTGVEAANRTFNCKLIGRGSTLLDEKTEIAEKRKGSSKYE